MGFTRGTKFSEKPELGGSEINRRTRDEPIGIPVVRRVEADHLLEAPMTYENKMRLPRSQKGE